MNEERPVSAEINRCEWKVRKRSKYVLARHGDRCFHNSYGGEKFCFQHGGRRANTEEKKLLRSEASKRTRERYKRGPGKREVARMSWTDQKKKERAQINIKSNLARLLYDQWLESDMPWPMAR